MAGRSRDYKSGYAAGYAAAMHHKYPEDMPNPPDELIAKMFNAMKELLDQVDFYFTQMFEDEREEDPFEMEAARVHGIMVFEEIEEWLKLQIVEAHGKDGRPARSIRKLMKAQRNG